MTYSSSPADKSWLLCPSLSRTCEKIPGLRIRVFGFSGFRVGLGKTRVGSEFGRAGYEFKARNSRATRAFGRPSKLGQVRAARVSRASSGARNSENDSTRQVTPSFSTSQIRIFWMLISLDHYFATKRHSKNV